MPDISQLSDQDLLNSLPQQAQPAISAGASQSDISQLPDSDLLASLEPDDTQPAQPTGYQSPLAGRAAGWQNIPANFMADVPQVAGQFGALASFPFARAYEALPSGIPFIKGADQPQQNPLRDLNQAHRIWGGIRDYYNNEYIQPLINDPRPMASDWNPENSILIKHFEKAPLQTMMDLGIPTGAKALAGVVGKTVAPTLGKVAERVPISQWYKDQIVPKIKEHLTPSPDNQIHEAMTNAVNMAGRVKLDRILTTSRRLDKFWQQVHSAYRPYLSMIGEYTDKDLVTAFADKPEVQRFLTIVRHYNRVMESVLRIPEDVNELNVWGAPFLAKAERARRAGLDAIADKLPTEGTERMAYLQKNHPELANPMKFEDLPKHRAELRAFKFAQMKKGVQPPIYAALMTQAQLGASLHKLSQSKLGSLSGQTGWAAREMVRKGLASIFDLPEQDLPGWLQSRKVAHAQMLDVRGRQVMSIRNAKQSLNVKDLTVERVGRMWDLVGKIDFMRKVLDIGESSETIQKSFSGGKKWERLDLKSLFADVMAKAPQAEGVKAVEKMFEKMGPGSESIYLPPKTARLVKDVFEAQPQQHALMKIVDRINTTTRTALFNGILDPSFPMRLALQTAMITSFIPKNPRQLAGMVVAHVLAAYPKAGDALPESMLLSHAQGRLTPKMMYTGLSYDRMLNWGKNFLEAGNYGYAINNFQRRAIALHALLYMMEGSKNLNPFMDLLNMERTIQAAKQMTFNEPVLKQLTEHLTHYMGDYRTETRRAGAARQLMNTIYTAPGWVAHATQLIKTIPFEHPFKVSALHALATVASSALQPLDMSKQNREMGFINMAQQHAYFKGWDLDTLRSGIELVNALFGMLWGQENIQIPSSLSPIVTAPAGWMGVDISHRNIHTGLPKTYLEQNPAVFEKNNKYYSSSINWRAARKGQALTDKQVRQAAHPSPGWIGARAMFPKQTRFAEDLATRDKTGKFYASTPYTYPGHPARRMVYGHLLPKADEEVGLRAAGLLLRKH